MSQSQLFLLGSLKDGNISLSSTIKKEIRQTPRESEKPADLKLK